MSDNIPLEICREILLRLPSKSLIRFRSVSKSWRHVIDDPSFAKAHTNTHLSSTTLLIRNSTGPPFHPLYSFNLQTLNPTNTLQPIHVSPLPFSRTGLSRLPDLPLPACFGLLLLAPSPLEILNPFTHERLVLPEPCSVSEIVATGLGYDHATDDYKVVTIDRRCSCESDDEFVYETHVYGLKTDTWRKIRNFPCDDWRGPCGSGVFLAGALHWMMEDGIIALDLTTEEYRKMEMPSLYVIMAEIVDRQIHVHVLGGYLMVSDYGKDDYLSEHFDVWMMEGYGAGDSWVKLVSLEMYDIPGVGSRLRPVAYLKEERRVLLQDGFGLYLFDVESKSVMMVSVHGLTGSLSAQVFHGSVFRLHDNCGVGRGDGTERGRKKRKARTMKMKMADTKLMFCVRSHSYGSWHSHESCYDKDSHWCCSSSEDED